MSYKKTTKKLKIQLITSLSHSLLLNFFVSRTKRAINLSEKMPRSVANGKSLKFRGFGMERWHEVHLASFYIYVRNQFWIESFWDPNPGIRNILFVDKGWDKIVTYQLKMKNLRCPDTPNELQKNIFIQFFCKISTDVFLIN